MVHHEKQYEEEFRNGKRNGKGTLTVFVIKDGAIHDGRRYAGQLRDDKMDGQGKMTYLDGHVEDGLWEDGKFLGAEESP